jgi:S-(hydroxymethyl)mycothiol dehydrogenase
MTLTDSTELTWRWHGAFADKTLVHELQCTKVDQSDPAVVGGLRCMADSARQHQGTRDDTVAVIGCSGSGRCDRRCAAGPGQADHRRRHRQQARLGRGFGATHTINARELDPVETIQDLTDGNGADVVIDAVGRPETWKQAFYARDLAGTVVLVGVPTPDMKLEMPLIDFFSRGGSLKSSWYGDCLPERDFPTLISLYLQGRLPLEKFVSERIGLGDIEDAFHGYTPVRCCARWWC